MNKNLLSFFLSMAYILAVYMVSFMLIVSGNIGFGLLAAWFGGKYSDAAYAWMDIKIGKY